MSKREKILIQICICAALFAGIWTLFLVPSLDKGEQVKADREAAEQQVLLMQRLIDGNDLDVGFEEQQKISDENYEFFYSVMNSYTIDEIINQLAKENSLQIQSLQIGDYQDASGDFILPANENQEQQSEASTESTEAAGTAESQNQFEAKLLKSNVTVAVAGTYEKILSFVDELNAKSISLRIDNLSLNPNQRDATGKADQNATISISLYGITKPDLEEEETQGESSSDAQQ